MSPRVLVIPVERGAALEERVVQLEAQARLLVEAQVALVVSGNEDVAEVAHDAGDELLPLATAPSSPAACPQNLPSLPSPTCP